MGGETELALSRAIDALAGRNSAIARQVIENDRIINRLELEIDRLSIEALQSFHLQMSDIYAIIAIIKITPILERIADHAANIARTALELNDEPELKNCGELGEMARQISKMLRTALETRALGDAGQARRLAGQSAEIDKIYDNLIKNWLRTMSRDPAKSSRLARLLFVAKHLRSIGEYISEIGKLTARSSQTVLTI